jgi:hypothetical protein
VCRLLKTTTINVELRLLASMSVHFDFKLLLYSTKDGIHKDLHGKMILHIIFLRQ